jgi:hypothetical protein
LLLADLSLLGEDGGDLGFGESFNNFGHNIGLWGWDV